MVSPVRSETARRHDDVVRSVLLYCEEHLADPLDLVELAAIAGLSPHHFHRVFRHVTGENVKAWIRRQRLEHAVYRMKVSTDTILQIAVESGFATHESFTRAFVRQFGLTPSRFRAELQVFRQHLEHMADTVTFAGFTDDTPLTLRFTMTREPFTVARTPERHLLFVRHHGYETLLTGGQPLVSLWRDVLDYADTHGVAYSPELLVGITHDDPYVTDDAHIRFDACLPITDPVTTPTYPIGYRHQNAELCVVRRHHGGLEEVAKTFALIGVEWLPDKGIGLRATALFETYRFAHTEGHLEHTVTDAYVAIERTQHRQGVQ